MTEDAGNKAIINERVMEKPADSQSGVNGMPDRAAALIKKLYKETVRLLDELGISWKPLNRGWGVIGEGKGIALFREDYERFLAQAPLKLDSSRYFLQHSGSDEFWPGPQARLRLNGTLMEDPLTGALPVHQGIFLNIYPVDGLPGWPLLKKRHLKRFAQIQNSILNAELADGLVWRRLMDRRRRLMFRYSPVNSSALIIYSLDPNDLGYCIFNRTDFTDSQTPPDLPAPASYQEWLFDIPDDF